MPALKWMCKDIWLMNIEIKRLFSLLIFDKSTTYMSHMALKAHENF